MPSLLQSFLITGGGQLPSMSVSRSVQTQAFSAPPINLFSSQTISPIETILST
jgi:hypothetical protein